MALDFKNILGEHSPRPPLILAPPALGGAYGSHCYIAFPADASVRITARSALA